MRLIFQRGWLDGSEMNGFFAGLKILDRGDLDGEVSLYRKIERKADSSHLYSPSWVARKMLYF